MIHILDYKSAQFDYSDEILLQYVDLPRIFQKFISESHYIKEILKRDGCVVYNRVDDNNQFTLSTFDEYIKNNKDIEIIVCNIDIFKNWYLDTNNFFNVISKKYPKLKFIVTSDETFFRYTEKEFNHSNVYYVLNGIENPYSFIDNVEHIHNFSNYYIINNYLQENYVNFMRKLFMLTDTMVRDKKYNFYNGVHKAHRLKCYELIKQNNLLEEGYFSYADFAELHSDKEYSYVCMDFLDIKTLKEYNDYVSKFEIPYYYDTIDSDPNVFVPFVTPPQTSLQSYFSITTETLFFYENESKNIVLSEKSFKPFFGFNIPLIVGQPSAIQYLKDLGFDLFEDLFDLELKTTKKDIFEQFNKNLSVIKSMTKLEIHEYYCNNIDRIRFNFENLTQCIKDMDNDRLDSFLNER